MVGESAARLLHDQRLWIRHVTYISTWSELHKIAMDYQSLNLGVEIVDGWISEIEGVDATAIPIPFNATVLDRFQIQNYIHTECITASGSIQYSIMRGIALQLLEYILTCAEEYYLAQSPCVYIGIGRWIERLREIWAVE